MSDVIGRKLVLLAGLLGTYACYLFETRVKDDLTETILEWFV